MLLPNDLAKPLPGDRPAGESLRQTPLWDQIREARREDDQYEQGEWKRERKTADHAALIRLIVKALATSKDLQLVVWLVESILVKHSFSGLAEALVFCRDLIDTVWDNLYPEIEEGNDVEARAMLLSAMNDRLLLSIRMAPVCEAGFGTLGYIESRKIQYPEQANTKEQQAAREVALKKEGKLAPEKFDRAFAETNKAFYVKTEHDIVACIEALESLDKLCEERFGKDAPNFGPTRDALLEAKHVVSTLLQKKRQLDPDPEPVAAVPVSDELTQPSVVPQAAGSGAGGSATAAVMAAAEGPDLQTISVTSRLMTITSQSSEPSGSIGQVAAVLRARNAHSSAPYLMLRGLRWGELRDSTNPLTLDAPPTEIRQHLKRLSVEGRWAQLLEAAENVMAMPYGRAWLDPQRYVVQACMALGGEYEKIAAAIRSELRSLLSELPALLDATLSDDTPAGNPETIAWLKELIGASDPSTATSSSSLPESERWRAPDVDPQVVASLAMKKGDSAKAIAILGRELEQERCGRARFTRKVQLARLCIAAGKETIAQPLLDDIAAAVEAHKLEDWEDREFVAGVLTLLLQSSKKIQSDAKIKQAMFERVCRLDPVQALSV